MKIKKLNCPNCSAKVEKGQNSCKYCGSNLVFEENTEAPQNSTTTAPTTTIINTPIMPVYIKEPEIDSEAIDTLDDSIEYESDTNKIALELHTKKLAREKTHRIVSCIVSAIMGVAGVISGILLIDRITYVGIALIILGILCFCKILYTFMRSTYNMTVAGYTYSGVICALVCGFGIFGGIELIQIAPTFEGKLVAIIPFFLALVSLTYFVIKTIFYIKKKH